MRIKNELQYYAKSPRKSALLPNYFRVGREIKLGIFLHVRAKLRKFVEFERLSRSYCELSNTN